MRHKDPATASQGQGAGRPDRGRDGHRPQRGDVPPELAQRRPARDPGHLPLPHRQGRHDRLQRRHRHRPLQAQGVQARRALRSPCATRTTGSPTARTWTRSSSSASATSRRASTRCWPASSTWSSAVNPRSVERVKASGKHAVFETKSVSYTDLIMRRDSSPGNNPDFVLAMKHLFNREQMLKSIAARPRRGGQRPAHRPEQPLLLQGPAAAPVRPREGEVASAEGQPGQRRRSRWWPRPPRPTRWRWPWCCSRRPSRSG